MSSSDSRIWRKFRRNPLAMAGLIFILAMVVVSVAGALIRPDDTINANDQFLSISRMKPGFEVDFLVIKERSEVGFFSRWWNGGRTLDGEMLPVQSVEWRGDSLYALPFGEIEKKVFHLSVFDGVSSQQEVIDRMIHRNYVLGTDKYGRDLMSRLMAGTVISLSVGAIAVVISLLIGLTLGLLAGYYRGKVDALIMWFTNVIWAVPTLLLVMAITFAFGTGFWKVFLAVGLTMWVEVARITRGQVLSIREKEYIEASRALGFSDLRIMFKHILPNIWSPIIVISAANFASAILIEAGLSFLGLGAQIPAPSWGNMIREHYAYITTDLAYLALIPGLLIMLLVLSFMMVGNGLRDALDVKV